MRRKVVVKRAEFVPGAPKDWTLIYPETDTETKTLIMGIVEVEPGQH
ncbi:MAG TPA: cupin domain-containing protein, partial [Anaerolineae bacterium]|nr:cupin domain-containing protein [Anaerolineae bacterium]